MIALNLSIFYTVSDSTRLSEIPSTRYMKKRHTPRPAFSDDLDKFVMRVHRGGGLAYHLSQSHHSLSYQRQISQPSGVDMPKKSHAGSTNEQAGVPPHPLPDYAKTVVGQGDFPPRSHSDKLSDASATCNGDLVALELVHKKRLRWLKQIRGMGENSRVESSGDGSSESMRSTASTPSSPQLSKERKFARRPFPFNSGSHLKQHQKSRYCQIKSGEVGEKCCDRNLVPATTTTIATSVASILDEPRATEKSPWYPAVVLSTLLCRANVVSKKGSTVSNLSTRRGGEKMLLYPVIYGFNQRNCFSQSSLRTELRVARTIAVVVGCFTGAGE